MAGESAGWLIEMDYDWRRYLVSTAVFLRQ